MKGFNRENQSFSLCGLNCGLCPMHLNKYCPGCGGGSGEGAGRAERPRACDPGGGGLSDARGDDRLSEWGAGRLCPKNRGRIALMEYKQEAIPVPVIFRKKGREI